VLKIKKEEVHYSGQMVQSVLRFSESRETWVSRAVSKASSTPLYISFLFFFFGSPGA
jgi:hypothetical protein